MRLIFHTVLWNIGGPKMFSQCRWKSKHHSVLQSILKFYKMYKSILCSKVALWEKERGIIQSSGETEIKGIINFFLCNFLDTCSSF